MDYDEAYISAITIYELEYGAIRAGRISDWEAFQRAFPLTVLTFGELEARRAAAVQANLAARNLRIGDRDALIAGTALHHGLELITANPGEFERVDGLRVIRLEL